MTDPLPASPDWVPLTMKTLPTTPMEMLARAIVNGANPDTLEKLLNMQERWERNEARKQYNNAIAAAKSEMPTIFKNREVSHGPGKASFRYEDLNNIEQTIRPTLSKHGLDYRFTTKAGERDQPVLVTCFIWHKDGHSEESTLPGYPDTSGAKNAIQALGSVVTYLQRYTLKAALGLSASNDDDGASANLTSDDFFITEEQLAQLRARIAEAGQTEERICKHPEVKIASLDKLPRSKFEATMKKLALNVQVKALANKQEQA